MKLTQSQADASAWIILIACVAILSISFCGCSTPNGARDCEPIGPYHINDAMTINAYSPVNWSEIDGGELKQKSKRK